MRKYFAFVDTTLHIREDTVGEKMLMYIFKPGNTHDQYTVAVEKNWTKKKLFVMKDFACLYSISEERQLYLLQSNWMAMMLN